MDCPAGSFSLAEDLGAAKIFKYDGSFVERNSPKDRYQAGFNDILARHFLKADAP